MVIDYSKIKSYTAQTWRGIYKVNAARKIKSKYQW